jgi:pyruvate-formate lyase
MKATNDFSARLREMTLEFQSMETEMQNVTELDLRALQEFRQSLDELRMTAWTISELIKARTAEKNPEAVLSFLASERLRRFSQMTRDLSDDLNGNGFTWETSGIQSLFDSLKLLQTSLSKMVAAHRAEYASASRNTNS